MFKIIKKIVKRNYGLTHGELVLFRVRKFRAEKQRAGLSEGLYPTWYAIGHAKLPLSLSLIEMAVHF
jgi:hypothetical protein